MPERLKTSNLSFCKILLPKGGCKNSVYTAFPTPRAVTHSSWACTDSLKAVSFDISLCISKSLSLRLHHWDPATWRIKGRTSGGMQSWKEGGNVPVPPSRGNPYSQVICDVFSQQEDTHLKGLCERPSPTLPHTSGWSVPAATPCSKDKNLPSSTCMKRWSPTDLPTPRRCPRSAPLSPPGTLVVVLSTVMEQLLRCGGSCLFWFSPPAASRPEATTSLTAFQSNQNTSTNHMVTESFGCFRWKDLCPQRLGQPIIAHSLCLPTSYDCSFHLIFNVAAALPH